jgi:GT2 family glycosyltransferase
MTTESQPRDSARQVLFIVLSYNVYEDTVECLESLYAALPNTAAVLVIDNASSPPVISSLQARFPNAEIVGLPTNLGWAGGNNVGIQIALERGFEWVCLLNNDTVFPDGQAAAWCNSLVQTPPALMHPAIYYWHEPEIAQLRPNVDKDGNLPATEKGWHGHVMLNFAYGACLGVHRSIFEKIGSFDERLFLQLEETDFYHRAVTAGYVAACDPTLKIFHKESRAFGGKKTPAKIYYIARNSLLVIEKRRERLSVKLSLVRDLYWSIAHVAADNNLQTGFVSNLRWFFSSAPFATAARAGIADYLRRRFGKMPSALSSKFAPPPS